MKYVWGLIAAVLVGRLILAASENWNDATTSAFVLGGIAVLYGAYLWRGKVPRKEDGNTDAPPNSPGTN
jgi:hypothetical protein